MPALDIFDEIDSPAKGDVFDTLDVFDEVAPELPQDIPVSDARPAPAPERSLDISQLQQVEKIGLTAPSIEQQVKLAERVGHNQYFPNGEGQMVPVRVEGSAEKRLKELEALRIDREIDSGKPYQFPTDSPEFKERMALSREVMEGQKALSEGYGFGTPTTAQKEAAAQNVEPSAMQNFMRSPASFMERIGMNALPATGSLLGARMLTIPNAVGAQRLLPFVGAAVGGAATGAAQEKAFRLTETEGETAFRHQQSEMVGQSPEGRLADIATSAALFRPSPSQITGALRGEAEAISGVTMGAGVGAGFGAANALLEGRAPTPADLLRGGLEGAVFNTPTRLGNALLHGNIPIPGEASRTLRREAQTEARDIVRQAQEPAERQPPTVSANRAIMEMRPLSPEESRIVATRGLDALEQLKGEPDAQQIDEAGAPNGGLRTRSDVQQVSTEEGGGGVQQSGQGERLAEPAQGETPPEVGGRNLGPGAANIEEFAPQGRIGAWNAAVDTQRAERGLPPLMSEARKADPVTWENTERRIEQNPEYPRELTDAINLGEKKSVSDEEQSALLWRMIDLRNRKMTEIDRALDPNLPEAERAQAKADHDKLEEQLQLTEEADRKSGTAQGRALRIRRLMVNEDFTLAGLMRRAELAKGGPLTSEETTRVRQISEKVEKTDADLEAATERVPAEQEIETRIREIRKTKLRKDRPVATPENISAKMADEVKGGAPLKDLGGYINQLVEAFVRGGIKTRDPLVDAVHEVLQGLDPNITRRETMDAISGYGDFKPLNPDAIKAEVRDLKGQLQQVAKLEDLMKTPPELQKTGVERRTPSDEERRLIQQVNELKKKVDYQATDPATQLKSALDSIETRLKNQIKDLTRQIETGEGRKERGPSPTNDKIEVLRALRDRVRATLDSITPKKEMTDAERATITKRALEGQIRELEDRIQRGDTTPRESRTPIRNAELDALRARRDALQAEMAELRALERVPEHEASKAQTALNRALVDRERWEQMLAGEIAPAKKMSREALTELESDARAEIAAMREMAAEIRKQDPARKEDATVAGLEKSAAEFERRLNEADFSKRGKHLGPDTQRVAQARALRNAAKKAYDAARKAANPPPTAEEIALKSIKTQLANRTADLQERMAKGDFAQRKRQATDISKDPEAVRLKAENVAARKQFAKMKFEWEQANRTAAKKVVDAAKEVFAAPRTAITSFDVSAPFRQGGFLAIGDLVLNPKRAVKQIGSMFKSLVSQKAFEQSEAAIRLRPNADLYAKSKLHLSDPEGAFTQREENMRSNLAERIPGVKASNRAYAGFLNRQRVDAFDSFVEMMGGRDKVSDADTKFLAEAINDMTGRSDLAGKQAGAANFLARYLFSPRFLLSRFKLLVGQPIMRGITEGNVSPKARAVIAAQYGKFALGVAALLGLGALAGGTIEKDRRSADFGKLKFGNTRVDAMTGMQQLAVVISRSLSGQTKNTKGEILDIRGPKKKFASPSGMDVWVNFGRSKLAPIPSVLADFQQGETMDFQPVTPLGELKRLTVPISYQDVGSLYKEQGGVRGTILEALNLLGMSVNTYEKKPAK